MKKLTCKILSVLTVLAMLACFVPAAFAEGASDWASLTEHYVVAEDGSVTSTGAAENIWDGKNFCLRNDYIAKGDYSISVTMQGTMGLPNTKHVQEGIIPWYVDANNYIFAYAQWVDYDRSGDLHQLHISGKIGGVNLPYGDIWCDGIHVAQNTALTLTVDKITVGADVKIVVSLSDGTNVIKSDEKMLTGQAEAMSQEGKMGIYAFNDTVKFTNFTSTASKNNQEAPVLPALGSWSSLTEHYVVNENTIVSTGAAENIWDGKNFCVNNDFVAKGDYSVSIDMKGTMGMPNTKHVVEGIIPWYVDENNYIFAYAQWLDWDRPGELSQLHISGKIGGVELGYCDIWANGVVVSQNSNLTLTVDKITNGNDVTIRVALKNGANVVKTGERVLEGKAEALAQEGKIGVYAFNDTVTFSNFSTTAPAVETDIPNTGDATPIMLLAAGMFVAAAAVVVLRKQRNF